MAARSLNWSKRQFYLSPVVDQSTSAPQQAEPATGATSMCLYPSTLIINSFAYLFSVKGGCVNLRRKLIRVPYWTSWCDLNANKKAGRFLDSSIRPNLILPWPSRQIIISVLLSIASYAIRIQTETESKQSCVMLYSRSPRGKQTVSLSFTVWVNQGNYKPQ